MSQLEQTLKRYRTLRLNALYLASHELTQRHGSRVQRNLKQAGFSSEKHLKGFDYHHQTTISKRQVNALLDFRFLDERHNLILIGPPPQSGGSRLPGAVPQRPDPVEKGELKKRLKQLGGVLP